MYLCNTSLEFVKLSCRSISSFTSSITKVHRTTYCRTFPTSLVFPDGSSTTIRYHEPCGIITLPVDLNTLNDDEKRLRIERRKPIIKVKNVDRVTVAFDPTRYINLIKKK